MAKLSRKEAAALKALQEKAEAPDSPQSNARLNVSIDLGDEAQVERAKKLGFLDAEDEDPEEEDDPDEAGEETPRRRGFFPES